MPPAASLSTPAGEEQGRAVRLELPSLWPYWMERRQAVLNSLSLASDSMALLTGPNMAGARPGLGACRRALHTAAAQARASRKLCKQVRCGC
jgi:hypothetical protein